MWRVRRWVVDLIRRLKAWLYPDRRTTAQILSDMHRRDIEALLDGSVMEALSLRHQKPVSSAVVFEKMFARAEAQEAPVLLALVEIWPLQWPRAGNRVTTLIYAEIDQL